jgi:phospholipid transport system substrate-binding protein
MATLNASTFRAAMRAWLLIVALTLLQQVSVQAADDPAVVRVRSFYSVLLDAMKNAQQLGVSGRYDKLAPAVKETFDLPAMTRIAVGPTWTSVPSEQQAALIDAFSRMTIATYASRFDGYSGERFEADPTPEVRGRNRVVHTRLVEADGKATELNYLMHEAGSGWKIVDVYLSGTVSELATRRSEFGALIKTSGPAALIDSLRQRTEKMLH